MSKIGKKIIEIPDGIALELQAGEIVIKGKSGEAKIPMLHGVSAKMEEKTLSFSLESPSKQARSNWGTLRALTQNAISGLLKHFEKTLLLEGVGYKVAKEGNDLNLSLGFSHPVKFKAPEGIVFEVEKNSILRIKGANKALVGQTAAEIRGLKKPEPYKGKGFRYSDEILRRKAGKKATASTG